MDNRAEDGCAVFRDDEARRSSVGLAAVRERCGEAAGGAGWKEEDGAAGAGARARRIGDAGKEARLGWSGPRRRVEPAQE